MREGEGKDPPHCFLDKSNPVAIYSVSQKNVPDLFSCNSRKHCQIFIIFGTCVTDKVSNQ